MKERHSVRWWLRPSFLRAWGRPAETLFAGPWVGELGWELMRWHGFVRATGRRYSSVIVCCREGHEALYSDFATGFVIHRLDGTAMCEHLSTVENPEEWSRVLALIPPGADHLQPLTYVPPDRQEFVRFGTRSATLARDVIFHARGRTHDRHRNWGRDRWEELLGRLRAEGLSLGSVGRRSETVPVTGDYRDFRDAPIAKVTDVMASAGLVIGPSSGPMHLASLCGTPHIVWTDRRKYGRGELSRERYERTWNPFATWVRVYDDHGFDPSVDTVFRAILDAWPVPR